MDKTTAGWSTFISALGMMCILLYSDVAKLPSWSEATTPAFVAIVMAHMGAVILAFAGGKMVPSARDKDMRTRNTDKQELPEKDW